MRLLRDREEGVVVGNKEDYVEALLGKPFGSPRVITDISNNFRFLGHLIQKEQRIPRGVSPS